MGAFTGTYVYTEIQNDLVKPGSPATSQDIYYSGPFYIGAALAAFAAVVVFFFIPPVVQDGMKIMDADFERESCDGV